MPVSNRLPARLVGLGLITAFCAVAVYGRVLEARRIRPFGRFNEVQIMERANALRSSLMTQTVPITTLVQRVYRTNRDGSEHPFWSIDYSNDEGDSMLRLGFDGESGDLHYTAICPTKNSGYLCQFARPGRLTSSARVLTLSRDWIYAMKLAPKMGPWNVIRLPEQSGGFWHTAWQCHDHTLNFSFDARTGRLIMAQVQK